MVGDPPRFFARPEADGDPDGPGLESSLTSEVVLDLLRIPAGGLLRISAALLFLGNDELFAFYYRDAQSGAQSCKFVSAASVKAALAMMPTRAVDVDTGWLPTQILRLGMSTEGVRWLAVFVPPAVRTIACVDSDRGLLSLRVPLPGLVFGGRGASYYVWAVKARTREEVGGRTPVFHTPLPNISAAGAICFGANRLPHASPQSLDEALSVFWRSPFNGHNANAIAASHQGDIRYLLQDLDKQGRESYPLEELCPIVYADAKRRQLTLDEVLERTLVKG